MNKSLFFIGLLIVGVAVVLLLMDVIESGGRGHDRNCGDRFDRRIGQVKHQKNALKNPPMYENASRRW